MAVAGELLSYRLFLNDLAGSEPGNSGVFVLDEAGLPRWQLDLHTLPVLSNHESRKQVFYLDQQPQTGGWGLSGDRPDRRLYQR